MRLALYHSAQDSIRKRGRLTVECNVLIKGDDIVQGGPPQQRDEVSADWKENESYVDMQDLSSATSNDCGLSVPNISLGSSSDTCVSWSGAGRTICITKCHTGSDKVVLETIVDQGECKGDHVKDSPE